MPRYLEPNLTLKATGNVTPSRIVKLVSGTDHGVTISASATSPNIGVAQMGTRRAPGTADDDGYAAIAGENVGVYSAGSGMSPVEIGGTVAVGDALTANSSGQAIATTTEGDFIIGWALEAGTTADIIEYLAQPCYYAS